MSPVNWDSCRRNNGTLNLERAARQTGCWLSDRALGYLGAVEAVRPIHSRQVAALAIANALDISAREPQSEGISTKEKS